MSRFEGWGESPLRYVSSGIDDGTEIIAANPYKKTWLTDVVISCDANTYLGLLDEDDNYIYPLTQLVSSNFSTSIPIPVNKAIKVVKSGSGVARLLVVYCVDD